MNKAALYIGVAAGVGVLGFVAYKFMNTPSQTYSPTSANPNSNPNFTTSNQQAYPFVANVAPRVDNSNQPWANNNRAAIAGVSMPNIDVNLSNANMVAGFLQSANSISDSLTSLWDTFGGFDTSSWFSSGDPSSSMDVFDFSTGNFESVV